MPYPGEHSCRLESPSGYDRFRREKDAAQIDNKSVDFIFGVTEDGETELQAMRFPLDAGWDTDDAKQVAREHCQSEDGIKFEPATDAESAKSSGTLERHVEFKATNAERRVAIGGVMVPDKVDLQGDFARQDLIEQFSDEFMELLQDGDATPGVMHSVFPTEHVSLTENRVLEESREIGGKEFPAGSWIQGWKFHDNQLWSLVEDGVLSGYSIGAKNVEWSEPMEEPPSDVTMAERYPEDEPVWQILDGTVHEVSSVDIPAVPDAVMVQAKSNAKAILDHVDGKEQFIEVMDQRGQSADAAERLWQYLQRAIDEHGAGKSDGFFRRLGKGAWETITGESSEKSTTVKEGRTLSASNRRRLMAAHDALEDALSADVDFETNRFTDNDEVDFDVSEYKDVSGGKAPDDKSMTDDDTPEWAESIQETTEENSKAIDELREKLDDDDDDGAKTPEWVEDLKDATEANAEAIESLAEASGKSQQLDGGEDDETQSRSKADILGIPGGGD